MTLSLRYRLPGLSLILLATSALGAEEGPSLPGITELTVVEYPTTEELEDGFARWARQHPDFFAFESRGTTPQGRAILMGRITDRGVADGDKQVALLTSAHGAKEMNAVTGLLRFMKWLLGDEEEAAEIRRRQKLPHLYYGTASPKPARGTLMGYVSTRGAQKNLATNRRIDKVIESLEGNPQFDIEGLRAAAALFPYGAFGGPRPERKVLEGALDEGPIEHGLVIRLLVPYGDAAITEVRLDGHVLEESKDPDDDGYHLTRGSGVIVEVPIPPGKVKDLHIVSCHYDTPTRRRPGFTSEDW